VRVLIRNLDAARILPSLNLRLIKIFTAMVIPSFLMPELIVSNFKRVGKLLNISEFYRLIFLKFETPPGIADLTASTASDAAPHSQL
jgi:hypothetical protein